MYGGQRAARLPLVHMVVPLVPTSNPFAPLADDNDQPTAARDAPSAVDPSSTLPEVTRIGWAEVMTTLSARRFIKDTLGVDAGIAEGWTFADHHATTSSRDPPAYSCNRLVGNRRAALCPPYTGGDLSQKPKHHTQTYQSPLTPDTEQQNQEYRVKNQGQERSTPTLRQLTIQLIRRGGNWGKIRT